MDLQMPNLSGFEASVKIRQLEKMRGIKRIPIIALSANVLKGVRDECARNGMDGYIPKPVRQHELLRAMGALIPELFHDRTAAEAYLGCDPSTLRPEAAISAAKALPAIPQSASALPVAPAGATAAKIPQPAPQRPRFDEAGLLANFGEDREGLGEVVMLCRDGDLPRLLTRLFAAFETENREAAASIAHGVAAIRSGKSRGLVAGDVIEALPDALGDQD